MSVTPDRPQREQLMDRTVPTGATLDATDTREHQMPSTDPHRGRNRAYVAGCLLAAVAAAVGGVALLTGGNVESEAAPTTPPPATSSPAPSPTVSTAPTPEDVAAEQAKARYLEYLRVTDQVANGGHTDLAAYDAVAIDPETGVLLQGAAQRAGKITTTGETGVVSLTVQSVELDPPGDYPSVRLLACLNVSQVTAVDAATGEPAAPPDFPDQITSEVLVQNIPPGAFTDGREPGWYVADVVQRGEPC